ncbi:MFS transporter [Cellvibrio sp. pealriver]|uniref:MFS transporter n=1 Tax=Cellvibrio sp. pealriver TaxID=1622269 RepID=UPI00066FD9A1|nr:MFS transporter [Cellvibrio sp. pealriver]
MNAQAITTKSLFRYGFIAIPVAFAGFPLYILAPDYYATHYGLSLTLLGTLLLIIRLFDAIQDPLIGWLTDRFQHQLFIFLSVAGVVLCVAIYGLFNVKVFSAAIWFCLCMLFAVTAYSVLTIVLGIKATLWTKDAAEQTRIAGAREAFGLIGLVIAVSTPALLSYVANPGDAYLWYAIILFILMAVGILCFSQSGRDVNSSATRFANRNTNIPGLSPFSALRALPSVSVQLFIVYAISMLASSIPSVLVIFYVRDFLGAEHLTGLFLLLYFLSGAAAMPLWKTLSVHLGKYKAWCLANVLAVAGFIGAALLNAGDVWAFAAVCFFSGLAFGADLTLPPSILADHIHAHDNSKYAGSHYALLAFIIKASLALASVIVLPILDMAGFQPQSVNSALALSVLSISYAVFPCILKLAAAGLLYMFFIQSHSGGKNENRQNHSHSGSTHDAG